MNINNIRLVDIKRHGGSFIIDRQIKNNLYAGTLYFFDKDNKEPSSAEVVVKYFSKGGAMIIGPQEHDTGYDNLKEYLGRLLQEEDVQERINKRKLLKILFKTLQLITIVLMSLNLMNAVQIGEVRIWETIILEGIILIIERILEERSLRL